jgi:hypothetical protein
LTHSRPLIIDLVSATSLVNVSRSPTLWLDTDRYGALANLVPAGRIPTFFFPAESNCLR